MTAAVFISRAERRAGLRVRDRQWVDLFKDWEREIERLSTWVAGILSIDSVRVKRAAVARGLDTYRLGKADEMCMTSRIDKENLPLSLMT